jgi:hypothetical protein
VRRLRVVVTISVLIAALGVVATNGAGASSRARRLPPYERDALAKIFDPMLRDLGLRTTRAGLQSLQTYQHNPHGRHLAIYVEPIKNSYGDAAYVENYTEVAKVFLPLVFKRWKGLKSFDVCQEPRPGDNDQPEPPPRTQILVSRAGVKYVNWKTATLATLIKAARDHPHEGPGLADFSVYFDFTLRKLPAYATASDRAGPPTTSTSTATS